MSDYIQRDAHAHGLAGVRNTLPVSLANELEVAIDNDEATAFLASIISETADAIEETGEAIDEDRGHEIADGIPSIYNHTRMMQLVGLKAYLNTPESGDGTADILTQAGYVLYDIAMSGVDRMNTQYTEAVEAYTADALAALEEMSGDDILAQG